MNTKHELNFLLKCRRLLWYFIVTVLVVTAISMTLARSLISNVGGLRDQLEVVASQYLEQPLRIETFDAKIIGFTPTFIFKNVSLLEHSSNNVMVRFKEARVGLSIYNSIKNLELIPKSFVISGINLVVTQNKNNTFKVQGIDVAEFDPLKANDFENSNELSNWLFQQDRLKLENSTIHWHNSNTHKVLKFSNINLQFKNSGTRHTLSGDWQLQSKMAKRFKIELDMNGDILNPASWEGAAYVKGEDVNVTEFGVPSNLIPLKPVSGIYNFEVWADFKLGQLNEVSGATNVRDLHFNASKHNKELQIKKIGAVWRWDNLADGWALNIDRFHYESKNKVWPLSRVLIESHHHYQPDSIIDIYADNLDLEDASALLQKFNILEESDLSKIMEVEPRGRINDSHIRFNIADVFSDDFIFQADFTKLTANTNVLSPGVKNLTGKILTNNKFGSIIFDSSDMEVNFPKLFREPIKLSTFNGRLNWKNINNEWHLSGENLNSVNADIDINSNLHIIFPDNNKSPFFDLQVNYRNGDIASVGKYLPVLIMDDGLIEWLDSSIESGFVRRGGLVLHGRLNDFPFLNNEGKFEVSLETENFSLKYLEQWPKIEDAYANLTFTGSGFNIDISKAKIVNSDISKARIYIKDFNAPELIIKGDIEGSTDNLFKFLIRSPIARNSRSVIEQFTITGDSQLYLSIGVPLSDEMEELHSTYYKGTLRTKNSSISIYKNVFDFTDIKGKLSFDEKGLISENLTAKIFSEPAKIRIYSLSKENTFSHHILVEGKFHVDAIQEKYNFPWLANSFGVSKWQGIFNFGYSTKNIEVPPSIVLTTDFNGVELNLPAPLKKSKNTLLPIILESQFISSNETRLNFSIKNKMSLSGIIAESKDNYTLQSAGINFGKHNLIDLQDNVVLLKGNIRNVNLESWRIFLKEFDLHNDNAKANFISPNIKIVFDVDSYYLSAQHDDFKTNNKQYSNSEVTTSIDPRTIPEFKGEIRNIYYGESKIGDLDFDFIHSKNGFNIKKINLHSDNFDFKSSGIWHIFPDENKDRYITKFTNVKFLSSDIGATLSVMGFKSILNKGKSNTDMTIWWHDSPFQFSLEKLFAEIKVNVSDGEIISVDPKAGRLLGLLSLSDLPRRLFGDFSDITSSGLSFDSINGDVRIIKGVVTSNNILIKSSLARIEIFGTTDMVKHEFDQKIKVFPNLTDTTAVVGGILGGLPTLIITKILGSIMDLDQAEMRTFNVTGTWEKPIITEMQVPVINYDEEDEDFF